MATTVSELFTPYVLQIGIFFVTVHVVLYLLLINKVLGDGPWSIMPSYTAHKIITIPVLMYLSFQGIQYWDFYGIYNNDVDNSMVLDRVVLPSPQHEHLSEFMLGIMIFWDVPVALLTPSLRQFSMIGHHIGMITLAAFSMGIFSNGVRLFGYYIPFYFGFIEISSLPLTIVDLFHPRHSVWNTYLTSPERPGWYAILNQRCRFIFAVLFMLVRTIAFPYVSVMGVMSDVSYITSLPLDQRNDVPNFPLIVMSVLNVFFSALQIYWGSFILPPLWKVCFGSLKAMLNKKKKG